MTDRKRRNGLIASAALLGGVLTVAACGASSATGHGDGGSGRQETQHENTQQVEAISPTSP